MPGPTSTPVRVLMLTATAGFRHDSIATARQVVTSLGSSGGFSVTATEDVASISATTLAELLAANADEPLAEAVAHRVAGRQPDTTRALAHAVRVAVMAARPRGGLAAADLAVLECCDPS